MKTATPPKGVTARWVSRRITRSPESSAVISRGTGLSEVFASTPRYGKHLRVMYSSTSEFRLRMYAQTVELLVEPRRGPFLGVGARLDRPPCPQLRGSVSPLTA